MENDKEAKYWLRDAEDSLRIAKILLPEGEFRGVCQNAQITIEACAKAVISCFSAVEWAHDPSLQLLGVIEMNKGVIVQRFGEGMLEDLKELAEDVRFAAPWHGRSVYGDWQARIPASEICKKEVAEELSSRAQRSFSTSNTFIKGWFGKGEEEG
jgi:HEPN domain-containing protein